MAPLALLSLTGGVTTWAMLPLVACSVVALALLIDRTWAHLRVRGDFAGFQEELRRDVEEGRADQALARCRGSSQPYARIAAAYLSHRDAPAEFRDSVLRREGGLALEPLERRVRGLAVVASSATLLGLLGTVLGLVVAFRQIEAHAGQVQPSDLAAGIWASLLTTVVGLSIAIPSSIAYHAFDARTGMIERRMGFIVSYLAEWSGVPGSGSPAPAVP